MKKKTITYFDDPIEMKNPSFVVWALCMQLECIDYSRRYTKRKLGIKGKQQIDEIEKTLQEIFQLLRKTIHYHVSLDAVSEFLADREEYLGKIR